MIGGVGSSPRWLRSKAVNLHLKGTVQAADVVACEGAAVRILLVADTDLSKVMLVEVQGDPTCIDSQGACCTSEPAFALLALLCLPG